MGLFGFHDLAGKLIQPVAAAEQLDIEHQLVPGGDLQLLIDAAVVLLDGMDADERQLRNIGDLVTIDVVIQDPPLGSGKGLHLFRKGAEHLLHIGRQGCCHIAGVQLGQHGDADHGAAGLNDAIVPKHAVNGKEHDLRGDIGHRQKFEVHINYLLHAPDDQIGQRHRGQEHRVFGR